MLLKKRIRRWEGGETCERYVIVIGTKRLLTKSTVETEKKTRIRADLGFVAWGTKIILRGSRGAKFTTLVNISNFHPKGAVCFIVPLGRKEDM